MKIAVPNKGSLAESSIQILKEAGYKQRSDSRDLVLVDPDNGVEFYYLRPRDIALYVGTGELQAGITGRDLLIDSQANAEEVLPLDFGASTFRFAAPIEKREGSTWDLKAISGKKIATAYPGLVSNSEDDSLPLRLIKMASLFRMGSPNISILAWRRVLPVLTTSAIKSATPKRTEDSTAPSSLTISALMPAFAK